MTDRRKDRKGGWQDISSDIERDNNAEAERVSERTSEGATE